MFFLCVKAVAVREEGAAVRDEGICPRRRAGGRCPWGRPTSSFHTTSTWNGRPKASHRQVRPASLISAAIHSRERLDAQPAPEHLAPAIVLTLPRTLRACSGRFPGSSRGQSDFLAAAPRCPPLQSRQLQRDASARSRQPPQVPAAFRSGSARTPARLWHLQHPWEGVPTWNDALSRHVARDRANCHTPSRILHVHEIRGTAEI